MSEIARIFHIAADRLAGEGAWAQRATARDFADRVVAAGDPSAMAWCACAAIELAADDIGRPDLYEAACAAFKGDDQGVIRFNDAEGRTQGEVVFALRGAGDRLGAGARP